MQPEINGKFCHFRGVSLDRLPTILKTGIDVVPPDSPIYAGAFDKAFEYGESPKVVMALDMDRLEPSFKILSTNMPSAEIENLRQDSRIVAVESVTSAPGEEMDEDPAERVHVDPRPDPVLRGARHCSGAAYAGVPLNPPGPIVVVWP